MDAELSWLGYLTSPEQGVGPGCWQSFQHGAMYWLPNLGAFALSTSINDKYNSLGGPLGSLGFPVHDEQPINTAPGTFFKFQNGKIFWRSTPESISVSMNSVYNFSIDQIQCMSTRSRVSDTLFVTASISIFGRDPVTVTKELGDHGVGFTYPNIVLENIPLAEEEIALFVYMIMNSGDSGVKSKVESMGRDLTTKGAQIAGEKAGQAIEAEIAGKAGLAGTIAAVGTWLGGLLDTPAPVVGNVIGGLLGSLTGYVIGELIDILITHCDGIVASATNTIAGTDLKELMGLDGKFEMVDTTPGSESPGGCGDKLYYIGIFRPILLKGNITRHLPSLDSISDNLRPFNANHFRFN